MEQEVKLLIGTSLQGIDQQFYIYKNSKLGQGGFGVVRKACESKRHGRPLAVKIIPYGGDEVKRAKIERQIAILRILPDHENLVRVLPYKCFSQNNFYIFMELCEEGTLAQIVRKPGLLQEQLIFSIFYQLMSGYRILLEAKIVHQDLKLANVLIKKGVLKITDFGFSILADKYVTSLTREGTLPYMPYQKLTDPNYIADQLSDIYSLGVIMFEAIAKMHPYVNQKNFKTQKEYVAVLKASNIAKPKFYSSYSLQVQSLFDIVCRMCAKLRKNRIGCKQLYQYLDNQEVFQKFRDRIVQPSVELNLPPLPVKIQEISTPIFLPFVVEPENEKEYIKKIEMQKENRSNQQQKKAIEKVKSWVLGQRIILYFFDRLARRLIVQKLKKQLTGLNALIYNKAILTCLVFEKRLSRDLLREIKFPNKFKCQEVDHFKKSQEGQHCIKLVKKDEEYTQESINDHLKRTVQVEIKEQKQLIDLAEKTDLQAFIKKAQRNIQECADKISTNISDKLHLVTLTYLLDSLKLLTSSHQIDGLTYEKYFYATETQSTSLLIQRVMSQIEQRKMQKPLFTFGDEDEEEELI